MEERQAVLAQRVVEEGIHLSSPVAALLEVDLQQVLQVLLLHDGRDTGQQDGVTAL